MARRYSDRNVNQISIAPTNAKSNATPKPSHDRSPPRKAPIAPQTKIGTAKTMGLPVKVMNRTAPQAAATKVTATNKLASEN